MHEGARQKRSRSQRAVGSQYTVVQCSHGQLGYIFEEAQEIGDSFALTISQHRIVNAVFGASYTQSS